MKSKKIPRKLKKFLGIRNETLEEYHARLDNFYKSHPMELRRMPIKVLRTYPGIIVDPSRKDSLEAMGVSVDLHRLDLNDAYLIRKDTHWVYGKMSDVKIKAAESSRLLGRDVYFDYSIPTDFFKIKH